MSGSQAVNWNEHESSTRQRLMSKTESTQVAERMEETLVEVEQYVE